jgi:hypothetical protein
VWPPAMPLSDDEIRRAALACPLRGVPDIRSTVRQFAQFGGSLVDHVGSVSPRVSLNSYRRRIESFSHGTEDPAADCPPELLEEAFLLAYLFMEGRGSTLPPAHVWLANWWSRSRTSGIVRDGALCRKLDHLMAR